MIPITNGRDPKQERSRETRAKILESTITCLAKYGWQGATTSVIAEHSGISRGALQHHFPTRDELVVTAISYMFERRNLVGLEAGAAVSDSGDDPFEALVEQVLDYYASELFQASLHVWTAAAADPVLRAQVLPLEEKASRDAYEIVVKTLRADVSDERTHRLIQTTLDLARGLGLAQLLSDDSSRRKSIAHFWTTELRSIKTV